MFCIYPSPQAIVDAPEVFTDLGFREPQGATEGDPVPLSTPCFKLDFIPDDNAEIMGTQVGSSVVCYALRGWRFSNNKCCGLWGWRALGRWRWELSNSGSFDLNPSTNPNPHGGLLSASTPASTVAMLSRTKHLQ